VPACRAPVHWWKARAQQAFPSTARCRRLTSMDLIRSKRERDLPARRSNWLESSACCPMRRRRPHPLVSNQRANAPLIPRRSQRVMQRLAGAVGSIRHPPAVPLNRLGTERTAWRCNLSVADLKRRASGGLWPSLCPLRRPQAPSAEVTSKRSTTSALWVGSDNWRRIAARRIVGALHGVVGHLALIPVL
jgi:hypothetical protein